MAFYTPFQEMHNNMAGDILNSVLKLSLTSIRFAISKKSLFGLCISVFALGLWRIFKWDNYHINLNFLGSYVVLNNNVSIINLDLYEICSHLSLL